jgi:hypothetical protein
VIGLDSEYYAKFEEMAKRLNVDVGFILAIVGQESTWMDSRHESHNNPFGLKEHDKLIQFSSVDSAIESWIGTFGEIIKNMQDAQQFFNTLEDVGHYDPGNPNWVSGMLRTYDSVNNWFYDCIKKR